MYIVWKLLFICGAILWVSLCICDYYNSEHIKMLDNYLKIPAMENQKLTVNEEETTDFSATEVVVLSLTAFSVSVCACTVGKFAYNKFKPRSDLPILQHFPMKSTKSASKIPVLVGRPSTIDLQSKPSAGTVTSDDCNISCSEIERTPPPKPVRKKVLTKSVRSTTSTDRQQDDMLIMHANSLREQATLSRRLEAILREKKELSLALYTSQRENRNAKMELESVKQEHSGLLLRLDQATKEIKNNARAKRLTLERLEQAVLESRQMQEKLQALADEKAALEQKVDYLDNECRDLKNRKVELSETYSSMNPDNVDPRSSDIDESIADIEQSFEDVDEKKDVEEVVHSTPSEIDIQTVQRKLNCLEASLDRLRCSTSMMNENGCTGSVINNASIADLQDRNVESLIEIFDNSTPSLTECRQIEYEGVESINDCSEKFCTYKDSNRALAIDKMDMLPSIVEANEDESKGEDMTKATWFSTISFSRTQIASRIASIFHKSRSVQYLVAESPDNYGVMEEEEESPISSEKSGSEHKLFQEAGDQEPIYDFDEWLAPTVATRLTAVGCRNAKLVSQSPEFQEFLQKNYITPPELLNQGII